MKICLSLIHILSLLTNSMGVEGSAPAQDIISAVEAAGYGARKKGSGRGSAGTLPGEEMLQDHETPKLKKRLWTSVGFLVVLMYLSMGHMMWGWPVPGVLADNHVAMGLIPVSYTHLLRLAECGAQFSVERIPGCRAGDHLKCLIDGSSVELAGYDIDEKNIQCSDKEEVIKYMHDDQLNLIRFWSADLDHDGSIHRAEKIQTGHIRRIVNAEKIRTGHISIIAYDVFGKGAKCRL